jgi:hypothetical protein
MPFAFARLFAKYAGKGLAASLRCSSDASLCTAMPRCGFLCFLVRKIAGRRADAAMDGERAPAIAPVSVFCLLLGRQAGLRQI